MVGGGGGGGGGGRIKTAQPMYILLLITCKVFVTSIVLQIGQH